MGCDALLGLCSQNPLRTPVSLHRAEFLPALGGIPVGIFHYVGILRKMKFFYVSDDSLTVQLLYLPTEGNIETPLSICSSLFKVH